MNQGHIAILLATLFLPTLARGQAVNRETATTRPVAAASISLAMRPDDVSRLQAHAFERYSEPISVEVGTLLSNRTHRFLLPLTNKTGKDLVIAELKASCGCVVGVPVSNTMSSGEQTEIALTVRPKADGKFLRKILLRFADQQETLELHVSGEFKAKYSLIPDRFDVDDAIERITATLVDNFPDTAGNAPQIVVGDGLVLKSEVSKVQAGKYRVELFLDRNAWTRGQRKLNSVITVGTEPFHLVFENTSRVDIHPHVAIARIEDDQLVSKHVLRGKKDVVLGASDKPRLSAYLIDETGNRLHKASVNVTSSGAKGVFFVKLRFDRSLAGSRGSVGVQWVFTGTSQKTSTKLMLTER